MKDDKNGPSGQIKKRIGIWNLDYRCNYWYYCHPHNNPGSYHHGIALRNDHGEPNPGPAVKR